LLITEDVVDEFFSIFGGGILKMFPDSQLGMGMLIRILQRGEGGTGAENEIGSLYYREYVYW